MSFLSRSLDGMIVALTKKFWRKDSENKSIDIVTRSSINNVKHSVESSSIDSESHSHSDLEVITKKSSYCGVLPTTILENFFSMTITLNPAKGGPCFTGNYLDLHHTRGFSMVFSFHKQSHIPRKFINNTWDCSKNFDNFKEHFDCDLTVNCAQAEDELSCPYTSKHCRPGSFWADGICVFVSSVNVNKSSTSSVNSWHDGPGLCTLGGGTLAVLNTYNRSLITAKTLSENIISGTFIVGMRTVPSSYHVW